MKTVIYGILIVLMIFQTGCATYPKDQLTERNRDNSSLAEEKRSSGIGGVIGFILFVGIILALASTAGTDGPILGRDDR